MAKTSLALARRDRKPLQCPPMRLVLVVVLTWSLVPGLREVVESGVHFARTGHVHAPHAQGTDTEHDDSAEHSCGATLHHCSCCFGQPAASSQAVAVLPDPGPSVTRSGLPESLRTHTGADRLFRPPIA